MSMQKDYYVIVGYDLTNLKTDKFDDWRWTDEGKDYLNNQIKGEIQLFNDPMSNNHLYLGYILTCGDEYDFDTAIIDIDDVNEHSNEIFRTLYALQERGVVEKKFDFHNRPEAKIIVFEECS